VLFEPFLIAYISLVEHDMSLIAESPLKFAGLHKYSFLNYTSCEILKREDLTLNKNNNVVHECTVPSISGVYKFTFLSNCMQKFRMGYCNYTTRLCLLIVFFFWKV